MNFGAWKNQLIKRGDVLTGFELTRTYCMNEAHSIVQRSQKPSEIFNCTNFGQIASEWTPAFCTR